MKQFPQLGRMAAVQYPVSYSRSYQRVECELPGGSVILSSDAAPGRKRWVVKLEWLNDEERAALEDLFRTCGGRVEPFRWLDPAANLLTWSAALDRAPWESDPGVTLESPVADAAGTSEGWRITNGSQTTGGIRQRLTLDPNQLYTGSCWVRAASDTAVWMQAGTAGGAGATEWRAGLAWRRVTASNVPEESQNEIEFGLLLPAGGCVEIYAPQLENQAAASGYRRTYESAGVYVARFNQDHLPFTATGPGQYSTLFEVISIPEA